MDKTTKQLFPELFQYTFNFNKSKYNNFITMQLFVKIPCFNSESLINKNRIAETTEIPRVFLENTLLKVYFKDDGKNLDKSQLDYWWYTKQGIT